MPTLEIDTSYTMLPRQEVFHTSRAKVRGYGGAMAGGKTRAICEEFFQAALEFPGIYAPIFRQRHNSITGTTRRTFFEQVLPTELRPYCKVKQSGGEDFIRFPNGSEIHFVGLDDPVKVFSAEFGMVGFDEAHEMSEEDVVLVNTRTRQRCQVCIRQGIPDCTHYPHTICLGFNPENPGHWLYQWFIAGADKTPYGTRKHELWTTDAVAPIGDAEFIFARASDNPYVSQRYLEEQLGGMPALMRRRYLDGEWVYTSGVCFFDSEGLERYGGGERPLYRFDFHPRGDGTEAVRKGSKTGRIALYEEPVEGVSYAIGADVASGRGRDFSVAYVTRLDEPRLVCELRAKIDPDLFAEQLHFLGRWYADALIAVEVAGGFGDAVIVPLKDGKGKRPPYPRVYRNVLVTRADLPIAKPWGYPMNLHTRPLVLNALEKAIREHTLPFITPNLVSECATFVYAETNPSPRAQDGCNDDCVMAAAIALEMYRQRGHHPGREERLSRMERKAEHRRTYPWQRRQRAAVLADEIEARYPKGT